LLGRTKNLKDAAKCYVKTRFSGRDAEAVTVSALLGSKLLEKLTGLLTDRSFFTNTSAAEKLVEEPCWRFSQALYTQRNIPLNSASLIFKKSE